MRASTALAALLAVGCVSRTRRPASLEPRTALSTPAPVETIVRQAVLLDAAADRGADTLYAPEAVVVANARIRFAAPRLAAVGLGGQVTITGMR